MNNLPVKVIDECNSLQAGIDGLLALKVVNTDTSVKAGFALKTAKAARRDLEDLRKQCTKPLDDEKKLIMNEFHGRLAACDVVIAHLEKELKAWTEAERKRQEEEKRKAEEQALKEQEEEKKQLAEAAKQAEENWDFLHAQELSEKAETVRVPVVIPEKRTLIRGLSERTYYRFRVVDAGLIPREFLMPNEKLLGELARSTKGTAEVPGVEFFTDTSIAG